MTALGRWMMALLLAVVLVPAEAAAAKLETEVRQVAEAVAKLQDRHMDELRSMAELPVVRDYFLAPAGKRAAKLDAVKQALGGRDMGSELCLIDSSGSEHLRAVRGRLVGESELAHNEVEAPFFQDAIRIPPGATFVSTPYLSPDVDEWVVGFVVPVIAGEAILHFEHRLTRFQGLLNEVPATPGRFILLVARTGHVIGDSRRAIPTQRRGEEMSPNAYFPHLRADFGLAADLVRAVTGGQDGTGMARINGVPYEVVFRGGDGISVVGFERMR